jgi:hypothetical protein
MEVLDNMVFVMEEGPSGESNVVAACGQHMLSWLVVRALHNFADEVHLPCCNHVSCSWYVVKHLSNMLILDVIFFDVLY